MTVSTNPLVTGINDLSSVSADGIYLPQRPAGFSGGSFLAGIQPTRVGTQWACSARPDTLIDTTGYAVTYYVDAVGGNDANTGLSWGQRVQSIWKAMTLASAGGVPARVLVEASAPYYRQISVCGDSAQRTSAVPILLEAMDGRVETGTFDNLSWTKTSGQTYVYQATRSNASRVVNTQYRDVFGAPLEYAWAADLATCDATEGSWYTDGTTTYVHPHGNVFPTLRNCKVCLHGAKGFEWAANQNLLVRGFDMLGGASGAFYVLNGSTNTVVLDDCTIRHGSSSNTFSGGASYVDSCSINGVGLFAAFDSEASHAGADGFGLHAQAAVIPAGLLVRCRGRFNGRGSSQSNNGYTTHDGAKSMSIGGDWRFNYGTGSAHVSAGTQAWCCGDIAGASPGDVPRGGSKPWAGFGTWGGDTTTKLWLDSCQDVGAETGVIGDTIAVPYLRSHRGTGQRVNTQTY